MHHFVLRRALWVTAALLAVAPLLVFVVQPRLADAVARDPILAAWKQARAAGSYQFSSDILQVTVPSARITNVGRSSRTEQFHLQGQSDLRNARLEMQLWSQEGSLLDDASALAVRVENGNTFVRQGGGEWRQSDDMSGAIAPQGDFMAYLAAVRNVTAGEPESRAGVTFTRYRFELDGPIFAAYVRDQIEAAMRQKGELPPGLHIDLPAYYRDMTGGGELWVRENGLPLRQVLDLRFPEQRDETVNARITVDFLGFGQSQTQIADYASPLTQWLQSNVGPLAPDAGLLLALLPMLGLAALMLHYRRARPVERALAVALIASLVLTPLLHTLQLASFLDAQRAKAATQEATQDESDLQRTLAELNAANPVFNPQEDPLAAAESRAREEAHFAANSLVAPSVMATALAVQLTDDGADTDQDGLTDFIEQRIGASPTSNDTDEDLLPDLQEVNGFDYAGKHWYTNPLKADSNGDGIADTFEWDNNNDGQPDDTDGDGVPDLFDDDNDGDGAPDRKDLSPFVSSNPQAPFAENNALKLALNNLQAGAPTFVDFQLRPKDPNHLWFAFNVLDWPQDSQGQVQNVDQKTYADLASAEGRTADPNESNGNLKLIPMLEIRINGSITNLPPQADLTPYNITVNDLTAGGAKIVYAPLTLITDETNGQRVAFNARMRYLPTGSWPEPHSVRLVWVVQALADIPCDPQAPDAAAQGCAADGYIHNTPQVIQTYYDEWTLTGLSVKEDHGGRTAIIYEDPAVDANRNEDSTLWLLTRGLDNSFLGGRDQDGNGQRDVDLNEIARRFDRAGNSGVSESERWAIPNVLRVEQRAYPTFDQAVVATGSTETLRVLNDKFNAVWANDKTVQPLLLYASEARSRALGLDALKNGGGATLNGSALTVDLQSAPQTVIASLKWTPYCGGGAATPVWAACDVEAVWARLEQQQGSTQPLPGDPTDPTVAAGRLMVTQLYNLALIQGFSQIVQSGPRIVSSRYSLMDDTTLETSVRDSLNTGSTIIKTIANKVVMATLFGDPSLVVPLGKLYGVIKELAAGQFGRVAVRTILNVHELIDTLTTTIRDNKVGVGIGAVVAVAAVAGLSALVAFLPKNKLGQKVATKIVINVAVAGISVGLPTKAVIDVVRGLMDGGDTLGTALGQVMGARAEFIGSSRAAGAIGAALAIGVTWGFFLYSMIANNVSAFSPEFNRALAEVIAATIYLIVLAVISSTVIGTLLVALIAVIDAVLTAICELGVKGMRKVPGLGGACFTLGTAAIKIIAKVLYAFDVMVDTGRPDLAVLGQPNVQLADPNRGFVADNPLTINLPVTTTIVHKNPDLTNWQISFYLWLFSKDNLRSTTFKYSVTRPNAEEVTVKRDQMKGEWRQVEEDHKFLGIKSMYRAQAYSPSAPLTGLTLEPGLNRSIPFYLNMGYALPAYECWGVPNVIPPWTPPLIPVCYTRTVDGHNSTPIDNALTFDIFPSTLDGFMALADKGNGGLGLAWDNAFRSLADADGDGLRSSAHGGLDPNDTRWDSDGDGLSDAFELERRQQGVAFSPILCDTDGDGLSDAQEMFYGADPARADTDNDGLTDAEELWHQAYDTNTCQPTNNWAGGWDVTVIGATTVVVRVSSNPTTADSDNDGVSDQAERQLALDPDLARRVDDQNRPYHPLIYNTPPLAIYPSISDPDGFVGLNQTFVYTATVVARVPMAPGVVDVTRSPLPSDPGSPPQTLRLDFDPLTFSTAQTVTAQTSFKFSPLGLSSSAAVNIHSTVRTRLAGGNGPLWVLDPPAMGAPLGGFTSRAAGVTAVAQQYDRPDLYRLAALTSNSLTPGGQGDIWSYELPGGQNHTIDNDNNNTTFLRGAMPPNVACNNASACLFVWDQIAASPNPEADTLGGVFRAANGQEQAITFPATGLGTSGHRFHPVAASDGTNFLVVAEVAKSGAPAETLLMSQQYDANGAYTGNTAITSAGARAVAVDRSATSLALVWAGNGYRLAWLTDTGGQISLQELDANGGFGVLHPVANDAQGDPVLAGLSLAYEPLQGSLLLGYRNLFNQLILQRILPDFSVVNGVSLGDGVHARVAYHPASQGWLASSTDLSGALTFWPLNLNNQTIATPQGGFNGNGLQSAALACPTPGAEPVLDLRFEELPVNAGGGPLGAATFMDSSGHNNHATATAGNAPLAGLPGALTSQGQAVGNPPSDYSLRFDGLNQFLTLPRPAQDDFTIAFWLKGSTFNTNVVVYLINPIPNDLQKSFYLNLTAGQIGFAGAGLLEFRTGNVGDDQWRFVTVTRQRASGQVTLYVDGVQLTSKEGNHEALDAIANWVINSPSGFPVHYQLDNLQVFPSALSAGAVQALYQGALQSFCVAAAASGVTGEAVQWAKVNLHQPDNRGGRLTASVDLAVMLDIDGVFLKVLSPPNGSYVQGAQGAPKTIIAGGDAKDFTSGVASVEVSVNDSPYQLATGTESWAFPLQVTEGAYRINARGTDRAGNTGVTAGTFIADATPPQVTLDPIPTAPRVPTRNDAGLWTVTLSGTVQDPAIGDKPGSGVDPDSVAVRLEAQMPTEQNGQWQTATLDGNKWTINYTLPAEVADPTGVYTVSVRAADNVENRSADNVATGVLRLDSSGPNAALSAVDGQRQVISETITIGGVISDTLAGIDKLDVAFTPIEQVAQDPSFANRPWQSATLAQRGAGVTTSTWQIKAPSGLEGQVQIDLRATDMLGNVSLIGNVWRGLIDTRAPRLTLTAKATGASYLDPATNTRRYAISYLCAAQDNYLDEARFQCPGEPLPPPVRSFENNAALQSLFPDWSIRSGLAISYTQWEASTQPGATMRACDIYGHCATAQATLAAAAGVMAADADVVANNPVAVIVYPADQSFVTSSSGLTVTITAEAAESLKEITLSLDGAVVDRARFTQASATKQARRAVRITPNAEGKHTLLAVATDWAGNTQTNRFPVTFTLDTRPPAATIETSVLTLADTYQVGSGILRFRGTANDSLCLAAVQLRVGNQSFVDVAYGGGKWQAVYPVNGPEGQTLPVTVRAVDCAGRAVEATRNIPTQLSSPDAPDTRITAGPPAQGAPKTARFEFAAVAGKNEVAGFTCQLDGGPFTACASPWTYTNLAVGAHTFRVRAVDSQGFVDETPAQTSWVVEGGSVEDSQTLYLPLIRR